MRGMVKPGCPSCPCFTPACTMSPGLLSHCRATPSVVGPCCWPRGGPLYPGDGQRAACNVVAPCTRTRAGLHGGPSGDGGRGVALGRGVLGAHGSAASSVMPTPPLLSTAGPSWIPKPGGTRRQQEQPVGELLQEQQQTAECQQQATESGARSALALAPAAAPGAGPALASDAAMPGHSLTRDTLAVCPLSALAMCMTNVAMCMTMPASTC